MKVFFITGRPEAIRGGTLQNLKAAGYKGKYELILQPAEYTRCLDGPLQERRAQADREARLHDPRQRRRPASDLKGGYSERTYKLPNPIYFTP